MPSLHDLFAKYGTDKNASGYTPWYEALFHHDRSRVASVLEVGIGSMLPGVPSGMQHYARPGYKPGGSLRAWRDYFPRARVIGLDTQPDTQFAEERISTFLCDSTSPVAVAAVIAAIHETAVKIPFFDLIIDDGDHRPESQIDTLRNLWPHVWAGGYYIIEDAGALCLWPNVKPLLSFIAGNQPVIINDARNLITILRPKGD